jgi:formylmethanofuran dehydrogenase subunit E
MTKTTKTCDDCKELLREAQAYYTNGVIPQQRLCKKCMAKWLGIREL